MNFLGAQAPEIEWTKCIGGSNWDEAFSVAPTIDSGFVVAGYRNSFDGDCSTCIVGSGYMFVAKIDSLGNNEWKKCYGGSGGEVIQSIKATSDGGYIFTGNTSSIDGDVTGNHGWIDYWVVKIDDEGNIIWEKCFGGSNNDQPNEIKPTIDGGYIICGLSNSVDGDVTGHHGADSNYDYWIVKISESGDLEWEKSLGGSDDDWCQSIFQDFDGGFICTGYTESDDGDVGGIHTSYDYWTVKLNAEGNIEWEKSYGGSSGDYAYSITDQSNYSNSVTVGQTHSDDEDISFYYGGISDVWITGVNSFGFLQWEKTYGGSNTDWANSINEIIDSSYIICGGTISADGVITVNNEMGGIWAFSIDSMGILKWQKTIGGSNIEDGFEIIQSYDEGFLLVGYTMSDDEDFSGNHGGRDMVAVKLAKPCKQLKYFADYDEDLYGALENYLYSCVDTPGYVLNNQDCNDFNNLINPDAVDICNAYDDDCDGTMDEDALFLIWYLDADNDGYGNQNIDSLSCFELFGYVFDSTDCNDENSEINPGTSELCNQIDDNCNALIDEDLVFNLYFVDADGDDFGNIEIDSLSCAIPFGYVLDDTDCDDTNPNIYPGAIEILNGLDDDCDGSTDENLAINNALLDAIRIYPNPAETILHIEYSGNAKCRIEIYSVTGEVIYRNELSSSTTIDISKFASGIYFLKIMNADGEAGVKVVKE